jgi:asparagine synthase (glutamine-hydrolysing)
MCGISGIALKGNSNLDLVRKIVLMNNSISHRGPDGQGFIISNDTIKPYSNPPHNSFSRTDLKFIPREEISNAPQGGRLALGHRRLSIIDLTEAGHQPMCDENARNWITFNGEIYNYIELRHELKQKGHRFFSECDTEVIIKAYEEWSFDCVKKFNGMWAFCIYDSVKQICFASRDRLGVKPFYYLDTADYFSFASEQKAFIKSGLLNATLNEKAVADYLMNNLPENRQENFFKGVQELWPGQSLVYSIQDGNVKTYSYFNLAEHVTEANDDLSEKELIEKIKNTFENSVRIRLRSDVEVGTCLSGGIDSSALAVTISQMNPGRLSCFTSIFKGLDLNEEYYADLVSNKINARHFKIEPTLEGFLSEVDELIYSQDVPIWDTSTYAQYKVMELAKQQNIKVVLDGQGADELFGGYHHHYIAMWNNLFLSHHYTEALKSISQSGDTIHNPMLFFFKERLKETFSINEKKLLKFFDRDFIKKANVSPFTKYYNNVNEQLLDDIYHTRLKSFLKCEDRCGMWHSVESRTPFSDDIELITLMFSFNGNKKIRNGVSKYLLREAVKEKLPTEIYNRTDKKGFETPMQSWMKEIRGLLMSEIKNLNLNFIERNAIEKTDSNNQLHNKVLFKLFVLGRWQKIFKA